MSSSNEYDFSSQLTNMYIYYTPNTFQNISKLLSAFIHPTVKEKIVLYDKKDSGSMMDSIVNVPAQLP
jgi:Cft2 family RNA processing exonuclease